MFLNFANRFIRNVRKPLAKAFSKPPIEPVVQEKPKSPKKTENSEFPEELKKIGLSKKNFGDDMVQMYKDMKAKGVGETTKKIVDKYMKEGKSEEMLDKYVFKKEQSKENLGKHTKSYLELFPGKKGLDQIAKDEALPESLQKKVNQEIKQYVSGM